jgi:hypothetical protein
LREIETGEIDYASLANAEAEYSQPVVRLIDALRADGLRVAHPMYSLSLSNRLCGFVIGLTVYYARFARCTKPIGRRWWCGLKCWQQ